MQEYGAGQLHSGSTHGPVVKNRKQAVAIAISEQRHVPEHKTAAARKQRESLRATTESHAYSNRDRRRR
jgi:hypothetical protein